jgi:hypothetical protein
MLPHKWRVFLTLVYGTYILIPKREHIPRFDNSFWTHLNATVTPAPHSHFLTRCSATTRFRFMSLKSQGYTGDGSLLRSFWMRAGGR